MMGSSWKCFLILILWQNGKSAIVIAMENGVHEIIALLSDKIQQRDEILIPAPSRSASNKY